MSHLAFLQYWNQMKPVSAKLSERFAECASSSPDLSKRIYMPDEDALGTLLEVILIISYLDVRLGFYKDAKFEQIERSVKKHASQGQWALVEELLRGNYYTEEKCFRFLLRNFSKEDIFGNLVPRMKRLARGIKVVKPKVNTRVHKPRRKRGYDDKGTLLLPHEVHAAWESEGPNPEKPSWERRLPQHPYEWLPRTNESGSANGLYYSSGGGDHGEKSADRTSNRTNRREDRASQEPKRFLEILDRKERDQIILCSYLQAHNLKISELKLKIYKLWILWQPQTSYGKVPPYYKDSKFLSGLKAVQRSQSGPSIDNLSNLLSIHGYLPTRGR